MPTHVYANNNEVASKAADGKSIAAFPDVCFSPPAPPVGPMPLPYPNTGEVKDTDSGTAKVFVKDKMSGMGDDSYMTKSMGDEPATKNFNKGMITSALQGKCYFGLWSMDVQMEGKGVPRHLDMVTHNHASMMADTGGNPAVIGVTLPENPPSSQTPVLTQKTIEPNIYIKVIRKNTDNNDYYVYTNKTNNPKDKSYNACTQIVNATDNMGNMSGNSIFKSSLEQTLRTNNVIPAGEEYSLSMLSNLVMLKVEIVYDTDKIQQCSYDIEINCKRDKNGYINNLIGNVQPTPRQGDYFNKIEIKGENNLSLCEGYQDVVAHSGIPWNKDESNTLTLVLNSSGNSEYVVKVKSIIDGKTVESNVIIHSQRVRWYTVIMDTKLYKNNVRRSEILSTFSSAANEFKQFGLFLIEIQPQMCFTYSQKSGYSFVSTQDLTTNVAYTQNQNEMCTQVVIFDTFNSKWKNSNGNDVLNGLAIHTDIIRESIENTVLIQYSYQNGFTYLREVFLHELCHTFGIVNGYQTSQFNIVANLDTNVTAGTQPSHCIESSCIMNSHTPQNGQFCKSCAFVLMNTNMFNRTALDTLMAKIIQNSDPFMP